MLSAWVVHLFEDVRAPSKSAAAVLSNLIEGPEISHEDETVSPQCLIPSCSRLNSVRFVRAAASMSCGASRLLSAGCTLESWQVFIS